MFTRPFFRYGFRQMPAAAILVVASAPLSAEVKLSPLFSDHMVLQQGKSIPVWGTAMDGEKVEVQFGGKKASTVAENGHWMVRLPSFQASAAAGDFKVVGNNEVVLHDVVVGEVWICSGQSNMEWPMRSSYQSGADIQNSANPNLRLFQVAKRKSWTPNSDLNYAPHAWAVAGPSSLPSFSAVGYYFGRDLQAALKVPVGIIHSSWGGSPAEVWMNMDTIRGNHVYNRDILDSYARDKKSYDKSYSAWAKEKAETEAKGEKFTKGAPWPPWYPSELYNGMIAPLVPYAIQGAIWYQGEANAGRAWQYRSLFADMVRDWRNAWGEGDFSFYQVQLAPWDKGRRRSMAEITATPGESDWAELREAQNYVSKTLPHVGAAVITDVGEKDDIHPTKKEPVGHRLALLAEKNTYHLKIIEQGPVLSSVVPEGKTLSIRFTNVGAGLKTSDSAAPTGFAIAGDDHVFRWAEARIAGQNAVVLSNPAIEKPVAVRYGWADYPVVNLVNSSDLPASPFRSDEWPVTTQVIH
jgi:sialate O-acetylesterase